MNWYYSKNDTQHGPVSQEELQAKISAGEVAGTDLVWKEGMGDWRPADSLPELKGGSVPAGMPPGPTPQGPVSPMPSYQPAARTSGMAIASLICGIIGLLGIFTCFIPGLIGIGGVICGHMAMAEVKKSNGEIQGRGLAIGGLVTGYLSVLMLVLVMIFGVVFALLSKPSSSSTGYDKEPLIFEGSSSDHIIEY